MPIYEYRCNSCGKSFSKLVLTGTDKEDVCCPHCGSEDVKRVFSPFGCVGSSSGTPGSCTSFS